MFDRLEEIVERKEIGGREEIVERRKQRNTRKRGGCYSCWAFCMHYRVFVKSPSAKIKDIGFPVNLMCLV